MRSILAYPCDELRAVFSDEGLEPYRAGQVLRWVHERGEREFGAMTDLGRGLRAELAARWSVRALALDPADGVHVSADGTYKLALRTADGARLETVMIPERDRRTVCVSSQIGCSLDCSFCATGRLGLGRNLRAEEIVDQVLHVAEATGERPTHVVFMGMGEPLLNLAAVLRAVRVLSDPAAGSISPRRITVSTAGVVPQLAKLGASSRARLAVSLHATTDDVRDVLVPLNRRFPLGALLEACRAYPLRPRERISFEYTLIRDVNDGAEDAARLPRLLAGLPSKVNLIPLNEHPSSPYRRPEDGAVDAFAERLARANVAVTVRRSRGDDIFAACGQLGALAPGQSDAGGRASSTVESR